MNVITLTGNSTKDVELRYNQTGTAFASGTIAVQRNFKNQQGNYDTDFINFKGIGKLGEIIAQHIKKGDKFGITGSLQINKFDKEDGTRSYFTEVIVNSFDFPSNRSNNQSNTNTSQSNKNVNKGPYAFMDGITEDENGNPIDVNEDDLPF